MVGLGTKACSTIWHLLCLLPWVALVMLWHCVKCRMIFTQTRPFLKTPFQSCSMWKTKLKSHAHVERCTGMPNNTTHNTVPIQPLCSIGEPQIGRLTAHSSLSSLYSSAEERRCVGMWVNREMGGRGKPLLSPTPACIHFRIFPRCCRCSLPAFQLSSIPSPTPLSLLTISDVMWCDVRCQKIFWSKGLPQFS